MIRVWVVRLGTGGELVDLCKEKGLMAIGWHEIGELTQFNDYENLRNKVYETYRNRYSAPGSAGVAAGMLWTFLTKINEGDIVLSPKNETREVLIGFVNGKYHYNPDAIDSMHPNTRNVQWKLYVPIDKLPSDMWRSMSAWQTLFELTSEEAIRTAHKLFEIETSGQGHIGPDVIEDPRKRAIDEGTRLFLETNKMAYQILATHFESFSGLEFQEVVSATLKAAGLFPKPIKSGADQGIDIEVYRDPLQLGPPRIIVQVKHRQGTVSGPEMRQFLGTMNREGGNQ